MDIDLIINKLEHSYYNSLNTTLSKNNVEVDWLKEHIIKLDNPTNPSSDTKEEINTSEKINDDDNLYKKSWSKLNAIHKIIKIKEFVNNIKFENENNREKLKDELVSLVKLKVLTKKDKIIYDDVNGKIISIKNLQYKDGLYFYNNE